jgi:hypothetical protein
MQVMDIGSPYAWLLALPVAALVMLGWIAYGLSQVPMDRDDYHARHQPGGHEMGGVVDVDDLIVPTGPAPGTPGCALPASPTIVMRARGAATWVSSRYEPVRHKRR